MIKVPPSSQCQCVFKVDSCTKQVLLSYAYSIFQYICYLSLGICETLKKMCLKVTFPTHFHHRRVLTYTAHLRNARFQDQGRKKAKLHTYFNHRRVLTHTAHLRSARFQNQRYKKSRLHIYPLKTQRSEHHLLNPEPLTMNEQKHRVLVSARVSNQLSCDAAFMIHPCTVSCYDSWNPFVIIKTGQHLTCVGLVSSLDELSTVRARVAGGFEPVDWHFTDAFIPARSGFPTSIITTLSGGTAGERKTALTYPCTAKVGQICG